MVYNPIIAVILVSTSGKSSSLLVSEVERDY